MKRKSFFFLSIILGIGILTVSSTNKEVLANDINYRLVYQTHVQNIGWQKMFIGNEVAGTTDTQFRLEAIAANLYENVGGQLRQTSDIEYSGYVQNIGWLQQSRGSILGTTGKSLQLEVVNFKLKNTAEKTHDIKYRIFNSNTGWTTWKVNGQSVGRINTKIEAIQIEIVKKTTAPEETIQSQKYVSSKVYSHMGSKETLEHTFKGYDIAIEQGSKTIDQDLVISKDGTFWVSHDKVATRLFGVNKNFEDMTDAEISKLTYLQDPKLKILSFEEVLKHYGKTVDYSIEIKTGHEKMTSFINLLKKYDISDNIIFSTFPETTKPDPNKSFKVIRSYFPKIRTQAVLTNQIHFESILDDPCLDSIAVYSPLLNQRNVDLAHKHGKKFNVWVLNTEAQIKTALLMGVDSYYTDYTKFGISAEKSILNLQ